jgi:hypothetical protein
LEFRLAFIYRCEFLVIIIVAKVSPKNRYSENGAEQIIDIFFCSVSASTPHWPARPKTRTILPQASIVIAASLRGAIARTREPRIFEDRCPRESGVALRFPPQSMTLPAIAMRLAIPFASWTAPAERQRRPSSAGLRRAGGAFARPHEPRVFEDRCPHESGVALRFPPQSMTVCAMAPRLAISVASCSAPAATALSRTHEP